MIDCRRTTELASDYLDHALPWRQRVAIRLHLLICEGCRRCLRQMTAIRGALRGLGDAPPVAVRGAITGRRMVLAGAMASVLLAVGGGLWQRLAAVILPLPRWCRRAIRTDTWRRRWPRCWPVMA